MAQGTLLTTVNRMQPMFVYFDVPEEIVLRALKNLDLTTVVDINAEDEASRRGVTNAEVATLIDEDFPSLDPSTMSPIRSTPPPGPSRCARFYPMKR